MTPFDLLYHTNIASRSHLPHALRTPLLTTFAAAMIIDATSRIPRLMLKQSNVIYDVSLYYIRNVEIISTEGLRQ